MPINRAEETCRTCTFWTGPYYSEAGDVKRYCLRFRMLTTPRECELWRGPNQANRKEGN